MARINIDLPGNSTNQNQIDLIQSIATLIGLGRTDDATLLLRNYNNTTRHGSVVNIVHNALYRNIPEPNYQLSDQKTVWDVELKKLDDSPDWCAAAFRQLLSKHDLDYCRQIKLSPNSAIASLGSCFATNMANHLRRNGYPNTFTLRVEEAVNSPRLIDLYLNPANIPESMKPAWNAKFSVESKNILASLKSLDILILTFGVGFDLIDKDGMICFDAKNLSERLAQKDLQFKNKAPEEQSRHITACIETIRSINPGLPIFATVSPVPLSGFYGEKNVIAANSISKAALRLAVDIAQKECHFVYLPTYEIITSIAPILHDGEIWGEDGTTRHPKSQLINSICKTVVNLFDTSTQ